MVELVMGFTTKDSSCKKVKFMMELNYESPKEGEASVEASP